MLELTTLKVIQITLAFIMVFTFGIKQDVSNRTREIAGIVWLISLALVFILGFIQ